MLCYSYSSLLHGELVAGERFRITQILTRPSWCRHREGLVRCNCLPSLEVVNWRLKLLAISLAEGGVSYEGDTLILLGFYGNFFDRPPQHGAVGPVVYALNDSLHCLLLYTDVALAISSFSVDSGARWGPACVGRLAPPSWPGTPLGLIACIAYVLAIS